MTAFLTGGSGFVGLALLERLLGEGRTVVNFDRRVVPEALRPRLTEWPGHLIEVVGDVGDAALVEASMREYAVKQVIHAAAVTSGASREASAPEAVLGVLGFERGSWGFGIASTPIRGTQRTLLCTGVRTRQGSP
jgi:nucleoside-diphosphate-sugar epimerase